MPMKEPMACCRLSIGTTSAMSASEMGMVAAANSPVSARKAAMPVSVVPTAHSAVATANAMNVTRMIRVLPNLSASGPNTSWKMPNGSM